MRDLLHMTERARFPQMPEDRLHPPLLPLRNNPHTVKAVDMGIQQIQINHLLQLRSADLHKMNGDTLISGTFCHLSPEDKQQSPGVVMSKDGNPRTLCLSRTSRLRNW